MGEKIAFQEFLMCFVKKECMFLINEESKPYIKSLLLYEVKAAV